MPSMQFYQIEALNVGATGAQCFPRRDKHRAKPFSSLSTHADQGPPRCPSALEPLTARTALSPKRARWPTARLQPKTRTNASFRRGLHRTGLHCVASRDPPSRLKAGQVRAASPRECQCESGRHLRHRRAAAPRAHIRVHGRSPAFARPQRETYAERARRGRVERMFSNGRATHRARHGGGARTGIAHGWTQLLFALPPLTPPQQRTR